MTREEELYETADNFSEDHKYEEDLDYVSLKMAFIEGAEWAYNHQKNVWHNAIKEPEHGKYILIEVVSTIQVKYFVAYVGKWVVDLMKTEGFKCRWAYIIDLLPKEGEK